jgi:hypothetical protein
VKLITHDGGSLVIGTKGTLFTRTWHGGETDVDRFLLLPRKQFEGVEMPAPTLPRTPSHHHGGPAHVSARGRRCPRFPCVRADGVTLIGNVALRRQRRFSGIATRCAPSGARGGRLRQSQIQSGWSL